MGPKMKAAIDLMSDGVVRSLSELSELGFDRKVIKRLKNSGYINNEQRGFYRISSDFLKDQANSHETDIYTFLNNNAHLLEQAGDKSVFCLYSACYIHNLSTDNPHRVWIAYPAEKGSVKFPSHMSVSGVRWRKQGSFDEGIDLIEYEGKTIRVTSPERTLVDLLRFSHLIGNKTSKSSLTIDSDTLRVAFRQYASSPEFNPAELSRLSELFGVSDFIQFYINISSSEKINKGDDDFVNWQQDEFDPDESFVRVK